MLQGMRVQHEIAPGWVLLEEEDGAVFLLEDVRDYPDAGADEVRHGPFQSVQVAREWLADELVDFEATKDKENGAP